MWSLCFPMQASSMSNPLSCLFSLSGWSSAALLFACLSLPFCWCQLSHSYVGFLLLFTRSSCISLVFLLFIAKKACAYKQWGTWENHWLSASGEAVFIKLIETNYTVTGRLPTYLLFNFLFCTLIFNRVGLCPSKKEWDLFFFFWEEKRVRLCCIYMIALLFILYIHINVLKFHFLFSPLIRKTLSAII